MHWRQGNHRHFAELYDRLAPALLRAARTMLGGTMLGDTSDAEDVVQDVFVNLVRSRRQLLLVEDSDAYVFAILRNVVGQRTQRRKTETARLQNLARIQASEYPPAQLKDESLDTALANLPLEQREVIALKIDGDLTFHQIGQVMNISPNTAASRYRYALEKLRNALEEP
jgi:RNA polymerase sigma-70 factor (ECF subfamily)